VYVIVRADLSFPQQAVQAIHAAMKASRSFLPDLCIVNSPNLVVCTVPDEAALKAFLETVHRAGIRASSFQEEDLDGQTTAFATELIAGEQRRVFRKCQLRRGEALAA
jgi:hypothetical protein